MTSQGKNLHQDGQRQNLANLGLPNYIIIRTRHLLLAPFTIITLYGLLFFCLHFSLGLVALRIQLNSLQNIEPCKFQVLSAVRCSYLTRLVYSSNSKIKFQVKIMPFWVG